MVWHPFHTFNPDEEELIVINPTKEEVLEMERLIVVDDEALPDRSLTDVIRDDYEIDEASEPDWPDVPVTVGLPEDWNEAWLERRRVRPIKQVIPQPDGVLVKSLKKKTGKRK